MTASTTPRTKRSSSGSRENQRRKNRGPITAATISVAPRPRAISPRSCARHGGAKRRDQFGVQTRMHAGELGIALRRIDDRGQDGRPVGGAKPCRKVGRQQLQVALQAAGVRRLALDSELRAGIEQQKAVTCKS